MSAPARIDRFDGEYRWLSNFYPAEVELDGYTYPTVEHAYQAAKNSSPTYRERIWLAKTPGQAKRLGRGIELQADWEDTKIGVMLNLLWLKFDNSELAAKLLATGTAELVEGNTWGDTFWGICNGRGENHLGHLLMTVRAILRSQT